MKSNRLIWGLTIILVLITIAVSFAPISSYSQKETPKEQNQNSFEEMTKNIPVVDYNAPDLTDGVERELRIIKNNRYDLLQVFKNPNPEYDFAIDSHVEIPPLIPYAESKLVIIGKILTANAFLSNEKKGIYSEFSISIETVLKKDERKNLKTSEIVTMDRYGGVVRYANGQKMLYMNSGQRMPETDQRYLLFLDKDDEQNPNYKLITGYKLESGKVKALDNPNIFGKYDGMSEKEFINLVVDKKQ